MPWATIASVVAPSIISGLMGSDASSNAAGAQQASADKATALRRDIYNNQVQLNAPQRNFGLAGQNRLQYLLGLSPKAQAQGKADDYQQLPSSGIAPVDPYTPDTANPDDQAYGSLMRNFGAADFQQDPGYAWRLEQGQQGLDRSAAARGDLFSGRAAKDTINYNQGAASQEYGNAYNRFQTNRSNQLNALQSVAGIGQTATNQMNNNADNYGTAASNNIIGAGNAQASGYIGSSNALTNGIAQGYNNYQNNRLIGAFSNKNGSGYSGGTASEPYSGYNQEVGLG